MTDPCTIAIEVCSGAFYWQRMFEELGHWVKIVKVCRLYRGDGRCGDRGRGCGTVMGTADELRVRTPACGSQVQTEGVPALTFAQLRTGLR